MTLYASDETHNPVDKAVQLLGIGLSSLRKIPVNTGAIDDLEALADVAEAEDVWLHVQYSAGCRLFRSEAANRAAFTVPAPYRGSMERGTGAQPDPSHTVLHGRFAIRVCITNRRTRRGDLDLLVRELLRIGDEIAAESGRSHVRRFS